MNTFKIRISGVVTRLYKRLIACLHKSTDTAAENRLLTEKIGFRLCTECSFQNSGSCSANAERICQTNIPCVACSVLLNGDQTRNAFAGLVFTSYRVTGPFGAIIITLTFFGGLIQPK